MLSMWSIDGKRDTLNDEGVDLKEYCGKVRAKAPISNGAARLVRRDRKHAMSSQAPPIFNRFGFTPEEVEKTMRAKAMTKGTVIAQAARLKAYAARIQTRYQ